ncbi:protein TIS11 [Anopheles darlingi]|uniref:protein TIS11 n=1 Tax=Anopheles darlingi TaxID=43151 RepID=UPI00210023C6|nr:protein TIS11 [Anopheles darlingi]XP_049540381.1 protein TIS11 [Anopheles darlingi]XP_049540382.1 protein TIS11 [Anopheles darlingi]
MSTAIMHSTPAQYEFGEFLRKNTTSSSRSSNTQMAGSGGGGGGGGVVVVDSNTNANMELVGALTNAGVVGGGGAIGASNATNNQLLMSQGFDLLPVGSNQRLNARYQVLQQQQELQQLQRQFAAPQMYGPVGRQVVHKHQQQQHQQQQQHHQAQQQQHGLGTHNALHRSVSQPTTSKFTMDNIFELLKLAEAHSSVAAAAVGGAAFGSAAGNGNGGSCASSISSNSSTSSSSSSTTSSTSSNNNNNNGGNNHHHQQHQQQQQHNHQQQHSQNSNTSSSSGHRKLERTQSEPLPQQVNTSRYKTELCRPYEEAGECKYGDKCQFAHGMHELRNLQRHPKYKTELCRTFHSVGFCPYGPRCHFVHNAEEARNHNRSVAAYHARLAAAAAASAIVTNSGSASSKNANNQQQHQQQHHSQSALNSVSVAQLQTAAALLQQSTLAHQHHHQQQQQQQQQLHHSLHQLPLSPALSMSTGSDRASPIGSLSLSPTTSMASFFPEAGSPTGFHQQQHHHQQQQQQQQQHQQHHHQQQQQQHQQAFNFPASPPASPIDCLSPMATPPPSSPSLSMKLCGGGGTGLEDRLPVFNRLSSAVDAFTNLAL